jgi:FkbM family methyltransferase
MRYQNRPVLFMLVSTEHGPLITTRLDMQADFSNQLYDTGRYEPFEISCALILLQLRRRHYGDGVLAVDCGACFGIHTIEWSKLMTDWGYVVSLEAQERLYYAVAGNVALNNCFNVKAINAAVGNTDGIIKIPKVDYSKPGVTAASNSSSVQARPSLSASRSATTRTIWSRSELSGSTRWASRALISSRSTWKGWNSKRWKARASS